MTLIDQPIFNSFYDTVKGSAFSFYDRLFPMSIQAKAVCVILSVVALWGFAIFSFGVPALVYPMMLIVPGMVLGLVLLTWGM